MENTKEVFNDNYDIIGQTIETVRRATPNELRSEGWEPSEYLYVIVLVNGVKLFPSRDYEGNGAGALFGERPDGTKFGI